MRRLPTGGPGLVLVLLLATACREGGLTDVPTPLPDPACGDGRIDATEQCDGANLGARSCVGEGFDTGTLACAPDCSLDVSACVRFCGNGSIDPGEGCDGTLGPQGPLACGSFGYTACNATCQVDASHCVPVSAAFPDALPYEVSGGSAAALVPPEPRGLGALVVAVPALQQLELTPYTRTGTPTVRRLTQPGTSPLFPLPWDVDGDGYPDLAFIGEEGQVHRARYEPASRSYALAPLNDATACRARAWVGPLARESAPGVELVALASCPATDAAAPANAVLLMPAEGGLPPTSAEAPGITSGALADVDGDGATDLLYTVAETQALHTLVRGAAGFAPGPTSYPLEFVPTRLATADFDGDGALDVAVAGGAKVVVLVRTGGGLSARATFAGQGTHLLAEDVDGDGRTDLAWLDTDAGQAVVRLARNGGGLTFSELTLATGTAGVPLSLSVGDLDADGDLDIAATLSQSTGSRTVVFRSRVR